MQDLISQFVSWSSLDTWCNGSTLEIHMHMLNQTGGAGSSPVVSTSYGSLSSKQILISILVKNKKTASKWNTMWKWQIVRLREEPVRYMD